MPSQRSCHAALSICFRFWQARASEPEKTRYYLTTKANPHPFFTFSPPAHLQPRQTTTRKDKTRDPPSAQSRTTEQPSDEAEYCMSRALLIDQSSLVLFLPSGKAYLGKPDLDQFSPAKCSAQMGVTGRPRGQRVAEIWNLVWVS